jgi:hypothetical protein
VGSTGNESLAEQRVVVDGHLGVERRHRAVPEQHERVDLDERRVGRHQHLPQLGQHGGRRLAGLGRERAGQVGQLVPGDPE